MAELLRMPEVAANVVEAVLNEWPLPENASFSAGDPIATVETDKAVVDVPAESDGVLLRTLVEPGKTVAVGAPMAVLLAPGEQVDDVDALVARLTREEPPQVRDEPSPAGAREVSQDGAREVSEDGAREVSQDGAREVSEDRTREVSQDGARELSQDGAQELSETGARELRQDGAREVSQDGAREVNQSSAEDSAGDRRAEPAQAVEGASARIFASPLARRIARENGLDVGDIRGTGPGGRIVRDDVRRLLADHAAAQAPDPQTPTPKADASRQPLRAADSAPGSYREVPHSRMRRAIAARLAESNRAAPVFTIRGGARVDALLALRKDINADTDVRISVNDLIVAAAARAHVAVPGMNVIWLPDAVRQFDDVDIAVAVATDRGLVTPVVRGVQRMTISTLARAGADLVGRARSGKLRQDELEGGTLTVTNLGVFGTEDFSAVINPPQAAILAVGAARQEAVVTEGDLGVATVLRVTLSVDHRPVDGATAAQWMAAFLALLESPLRILT